MSVGKWRDRFRHVEVKPAAYNQVRPGRGGQEVTGTGGGGGWGPFRG